MKKPYLSVQSHLLAVDKVVVAAVNVVAHNSGVGSLQGWGCDGHGRGLLLLLSWTALHDFFIFFVTSSEVL